MGLFSTLKRNSRLALKGCWGTAILLMLIFFGVTVLLLILQQTAINVFVVSPMLNNPTMEPNITDDPIQIITATFQFSFAEWIIVATSTILTILLIAPLSLGIQRWFFNLVHSRRLSVAEAFHFFETAHNYSRAVWYDICISIRCALWAIPFYAVPCGIFGASIFFLSRGAELTRGESAVASTGIFISAVLFLLATIFYFACICRYLLVPYLLAEDDDISVSLAIKTSVEYTKGFRFSLMWFELSYIGWFFLLVFLFPILYIGPYYSTGVAMYARFIIEKNRYVQPEATREFSTRTDEIAYENKPANAGEDSGADLETPLF